MRVSISFAIPADLAPGAYQVLYCGEPCTPGRGLGDLIGGNLWVGVEPGRPLHREWPLDEPEIANLAPGALVTGPGFQATAAEVLGGEVVAPQPPWGGQPPQPPVAVGEAQVEPLPAPPGHGSACT